MNTEIDFSKITVTTEHRPDVLCNCKKSCECEPVKCLSTNVLQTQYATMLLNIVTSWQKILSDKVVPSEKLVKETIDQVKKDCTYTAGTGISISSDNVISNTQTSAEWSKITGDILTQSDLQTEFATKQNKLIAGLNILINGDKISATDTIYDDTQVKADIVNNTTKIGLEETARISADSNLLSQINTKLNILTPGLNILINGDTISAIDTIYDDTLIKLDLEDTQHTTATILNTFHQILQWQNE